MFSKPNNSPSQAVPVALSRAQRLVQFFRKRPAYIGSGDNKRGGRMLSDLELRRAIETFKKTHRERSETDDLIPSWRVLRDLDPVDFTRGCRGYLKTGAPQFPKPSDIRRHAKAATAYTAPDFYQDPQDEAPRAAFDKAAFRKMLRDAAGIDLDGPKPLTPVRRHDSGGV